MMKNKTIALLIFLLFQTISGFACSCFEVQLDSSFNNSSLIFRGKVKEIINGKFYNYQGFSSSIVNFEVLEGYKKAKVDEGIVSIIAYNSSCDFYFEENKEYIVFAYDLGYGHYSTSICTKTAETTDFDSDELKRLLELAGNWVDDLYNYRDLLVLDKTTYNALTKENEELSDLVEGQEEQFKLMTYLIVGLIVSFVLFIIVARYRKSSS